MPELPEVEITARLIGAAVAGAEIESALTPGINALRSFDPPLTAIEGRKLTGITRRGKLFVVGIQDDLSLLIHLMSAGRLQLFDTRASLRDRTSRFLLRLDDGRELRLREFGTKQAAWVKLLRPDGMADEETLARLGPEAFPDPPPFRPLLDAPRPLHGLLRDQRVLAGIGRSWVDEILHAAKLSPFKRGSELSDEEAATLRDRTSRFLLRLDDGRELRLREFGTKQAAWVKLLRAEDLEAEDTLAKLGPEAFPDPPPFAELLDAPRPLHGLLRDQRVLAGIGRSWVDEILHGAMLSPFKRGSELSDHEGGTLREATIAALGRAIAHYEQVVSLPIPDKLPMPLTVHRRNGEPCPRCGDKLEAVFYEDYVMCYCPTCQTDGKLLKDRRLSRLLK